MKRVTSRNDFNSEVNKGNVCLKFGAEWCGPCGMLAEIIENIESNYNNVNFIEVDVDDFDDETLFDEYKIKNIPVLYFIKDGLIGNKTVGLISEDVLNNYITEMINN